jgi:putative DNA primase/helicase
VKRALAGFEIEREFRSALAALGIVPHRGDALAADGRLHRFRIEGDKPGSKNGWYVLHTDGAVPAGAFGSWKTGESGTWAAKADPALSSAEREALRRTLREAQTARDIELQRVRQAARVKAEKLWNLAAPAESHPYLEAKGVRPYGLRRLKTQLIVPVRDPAGRLLSLQLIDAAGAKRFLTGGEVAGGYCAIGKPEGTLCICEGFATGASLHEATGLAVAVAFHAGNLEPAARALRAKFPSLRLVLCADNDQFTDGNPGRRLALRAAEAVGGLVAAPAFEPSELESKPTDFNDLHRLRGLSAVREALRSACENVVPIGQARSRKELEKLIEAADDFDQLTGPLLAQVIRAGLPAAARERLLSRIAKKAGVPKASLALAGEGEGSGRPPKRESGRDWLGELNEKHAILPIGGKILILNREWEPALSRPLLTFSDRTHFENRYCNRTVWEHGEEVPLGRWWMEHPERREYAGLVFAPAREVPGYLNLWQGWGVPPRPGRCTAYLEFVLDVICDGDDALCDYLLSWCAYLVQFPEQLPETALVLRGREGIGKNTFVDPLRDIVGRAHYLMLSSLNQVTGRFSGHLANALLVFCNESVWGGNKDAQGVLKSMITEDVQAVEHKGRDIVMVKSCRHLIFATNEHWAVPRGADDRRYVIADVSDAYKGDFDYFQRIKDELRDGGTAALFQYLLDRELGGWHPRNVPPHLQENGWEMKIQSGGSIVQWWVDVLQRGWLYQESPTYGEETLDVWPSIVPMERVQKSYVGWCTEYKVFHIEHSTTVGKSLRDWGLRTGRPRTDNPGRKLFYKLPALAEARAIFGARFALPAAAWEGGGVAEEDLP